MSLSVLLVIATVVVSALTLAACGGSDSGPDQATGGSASGSAAGGDHPGESDRTSRSARRDSTGENLLGRRGSAAESPLFEAGAAPPPPVGEEEELSRLSKEEFIARADRVCRSFRWETARLYSGQAGESTSSFFPRLIKLARRSLSQQKAIPLPVDGRRGAARYIDLLEESVRLLEELGGALEREDERRIERVSDRIERSSTRNGRFTRASRSAARAERRRQPI